MTMRIVIIALFITVVMSLSPAPGAAQSEACTGLQQYFATADHHLADRFITLAQDGEWLSRMNAAMTKAGHSDLSILVLSPDEMDAFATFLSVPGDVLLSMEERGEVPEIARGLHSSALQIWLLFPPMMRAVASGGVFGALPFAEELERLEAENLQAQIELEQACPREVAESRAAATEIDGEGIWTGFQNALTGSSNKEGVAFDILFFVDSGTTSGILPGSIQSPTEEAIDIAAAQTEVAESRATLSAQETQIATISAAATADDETPSTETDESGGFSLSDAPFYSDGSLWGPTDARLGYDDGVIFSSNPDGSSLGRDDVEVQPVSDDQGQSLAICANGDCTDATSDSADGPHTDEPIGWVDGRLLYQRFADGQPVEIRAVTWIRAPIDDALLGTIDQPVSALGFAYPVEGGTLVPTASAWLLVSHGAAQIVDSNPYGDIRLVRTNYGDEALITYVANGQVIIASVSSPGTPLSTVPFSGVDYDLSTRSQAVAVSTGSGIELYDLTGSLLAASDTSIQTGSLLWLQDGIVFIDLTNEKVRLVSPDMLYQ